MKMLIPSPSDGFIYLFIFSLLSDPISQIVNDEDVSGIRSID